MSKRKYILIFILSLILLIVGCSKVASNPQTSKNSSSNDVKKIVNLNFIKVPDLLVLNTPEIISELKEISQPKKVIRERIKEKGEISVEEQRELEIINKQIQELMLQRKIIADKNAISKLFKNIKVLDVELIEHDKLKKPSELLVFSYDLIDDADKGFSGNEYEKYFRYIIIDRNRNMIIPIMSEDKKNIFWGKVKISEDLLNQFIELNKIGVIDKELMSNMLKVE